MVANITHNSTDLLTNSTNAMDLLTNLTNTTTTSAQHCMDNRQDMEFYTVHIPQVMDFYRIVPPIWWFIGILGNIMALIVWLQPKMRHSSGCYLAALALTDLCFLILSIVFEVHYHYKSVLDEHGLCQWFALSYLAVQYMSPVFVLAFTVERYLSVCHPFRMVNFNQSNIKVTTIVILSLALFILVLNGAQAFFWAAGEHPEKGKVCDIRQDFLEPWTILSWTNELLIFAAVPLTVLILNILVICEVRTISNLERRNMRTKSIDRRSTTFMLLGVSFYQIFTVLPATIIGNLYSQFPAGSYCIPDEEKAADPTWAAHFSYRSARVLIMNICMSHYAVNFFIYTLTGKLFRKQLHEMLVIFCCKEKLLYLTTKAGVYTSTRTTRMSLTSHRGSIGKGRLASLKILVHPDQCNNVMDDDIKNSVQRRVSYSEGETTANNCQTSNNKPSISTGMLPMVKETDSDIEASERNSLVEQR